MSSMPRASIIVPCYNEEDTIQLLLKAVYAQTVPRHELEVIIADGMSTDGTRESIRAFSQSHADLLVRVVDNPDGSIPHGLNRALEASVGDYIVRLDAHSMPKPDYVERCIAALEGGKGDNVGGVWDIRPLGDSWQARSIAAAAAHPFGVGDAAYRYTDSAQVVDTVPFGSFRRSLVDEIGPFDENLLTNEDYEFNTRIRQAGGKIWLDPEIISTYYARSTFCELAQQYWRYGYWKARMLRSYPGSLRWRQALPPVFILSLTMSLILAPWFPLLGLLFVLELAAYILVLSLVGLQVGIKHRKITLIIGVPLSIAIMHMTWGSAFLWSLVTR